MKNMKYYDAKTGEEVEFNKSAYMSNKGDLVVVSRITLDYLLGEGIITEVSPKVKEVTPPETVVRRLINLWAEEKGYKDNQKAFGTIRWLYNIEPWAVKQILLRQAAIVLDKPYPDHILKAKDLVYFDVFKGYVKDLLPYNYDIDLKSMGLFRSDREALGAYQDIDNGLTILFGEQEG